MGNNKILRLIGPLFLMVGILAIIISGIVLFIGHQKEHDWDKVDSHITGIDVVYQSKGYNHIVFVDYSYKGQIYERTLNKYISTMRPGDTVEIYVNPNDPYEIHTSMGLLIIIP